MDLEEDTGDPFAIDDLWRPSRFAFEPLQPLPSLLKEEVDSDLIRLDRDPFEKTFTPFPNLEQGLIEFSDYAPLPLDAIEPIEESTASSDSGVVYNIDDDAEVEDIWALGEDLTAVRPSTKLLSWNTFLDPVFLEPPSAYLSEHGPVAFDAALALRADLCDEKPGRLTENNVYLRALLELGLGRNSMFFRFDNLTQTFLQDVEDVSISGISLQVMESVIREFMACGTNMKKLRSFVHATMISYKASPALFSLASAVSIIIFSLEAQLERSSPSNATLLQLSTLFERSGAITKCLIDLVSSTKLTESDEELMSIVFKKCERLTWQHEWLTSLLNEVVLRVADPWLNFVEEWIGLRSSLGQFLGTDGEGKSFVKTTSREIVNDSGKPTTEVEYELREGTMPSFIGSEHARTIFECGKSLRLLSELHPEHPIVTSGMESSSYGSPLRWASSWVDLEAIQAKADRYEQDLRATILEYNRDGPVAVDQQDASFNEDTDSSEMFWWAEDKPRLDAFDSVQNFGKPLAGDHGFTSDNLYKLLDSTEWCKTSSNPTNKTPFAPPFSLAPTLSLTPLLSAQSRLINFSCLHFLFSEYDLLSHFSLQRRYHLFGDGVFTSRLSQSLFDPEMSSADRKSGIGRSGSSTGLRLGNRDTWPPAPSELRLVLMGLLNDTYRPNSSSHASKTDSSLPGNLSFAVRDLSEEKMEKCKNPNTIEALDFLRLQYKPPRALETIITPLCLYKYDRLFKFLLRIFRMLAVVRSLIRDVTDRSRSSRIRDVRNVAQKFRVEAHHFVSTLCDYALTAGIDGAWDPFQRKLALVARDIEKGDIDAAILHAGSLNALQELHEETLNRIITSLFLTKSQKQVRVLLEDVFNCVLAFAPLSRTGGGDDEKLVLELYHKFRKHVSSFLRFLGGLEEGRGLGRRNGFRDEEGSGLERLLVRLEMNDYYSR